MSVDRIVFHRRVGRFKNVHCCSEDADVPKVRKKLGVFFINGNPGCMDFYIPFLSQVADNLMHGTCPSFACAPTEVEVMSWSHANHFATHEDDKKIDVNFDCLSYEEQVDYSTNMVLNHCKESNCDQIVFIGHSIGCKIVLEILQSQPVLLEKTSQVVMLLPFILWSNLHFCHKLSLQTFLALYNPITSKLIQNTTSLLFAVFNSMPRILKRFAFSLLTGFSLSTSNLNFVAESLFSPRVVSNFFAMGYSEIKVVIRDEQKTVDFLTRLDESKKVRLSALFTTDDLWAPLGDYLLLKSILKNSKRNIVFIPHLTHSFCLLSKSIEQVLEFVCC
jgi:hypothetical protein